MICNAVQSISRCHCARNKRKKDLYHKIAQSHFEVCNECYLFVFVGGHTQATHIHLQDLKGHECVATLTEIVWSDYAVVQRFVNSILPGLICPSDVVSTPPDVQHSSYITSTLCCNSDNHSGFSCKDQRCQYV